MSSVGKTALEIVSKRWRDVLLSIWSVSYPPHWKRSYLQAQWALEPAQKNYPPDIEPTSKEQEKRTYNAITAIILDKLSERKLEPPHEQEANTLLLTPFAEAVQENDDYKMTDKTNYTEQHGTNMDTWHSQHHRTASRQLKHA